MSLKPESIDVMTVIIPFGKVEHIIFYHKDSKVCLEGPLFQLEQLTFLKQSSQAGSAEAQWTET